MTGEYWAELENNHHYIIVDSEHDRTFYCPAEEVANSLSHILNDKNKTIRRLTQELTAFKRGIRSKPIYEIFRYVNDGDDSHHVAFVDSEDFAIEFCGKYKDCGYDEVHITKYPNELRYRRANVPTCSNCKHLTDKNHPISQWCLLTNDPVKHNEYCMDWELDE